MSNLVAACPSFYLRHVANHRTAPIGRTINQEENRMKPVEITHYVETSYGEEPSFIILMSDGKEYILYVSWVQGAYRASPYS